MEKTITFLGKEVKVAFNMAVEIAYEKITGKPFTNEDINNSESTLALYFAVLTINNPDLDFSIDDILLKAKGGDLRAMSAAVVECFLDWAEVPETLPAEKAKKEDEGETPNA